MNALIAAISSRGIIILVFWLVTIITAVQAMYRSSFTVGIEALAACVLCYWGASGFMGSLLARREKNFRPLDLAGMGAIALGMVAAGAALMFWSGFWLRLFDVEIGGVIWALLGAVSAVVVVRKDDALKGDWTMRR